MAYRNKTYIAFDGDTDMHYYRMLTAWSANDKFSVDFADAHDLNTAKDSSQEESIKRQLRERFAKSKAFIVLIGENTWRLTKFVQWEIETAIRLDLPIIGVNLNGGRRMDNRVPPSLKPALAVYVPFGDKIIAHAINTWPNDHSDCRKQGKSGAFYYNDSVYQTLGIK